MLEQIRERDKSFKYIPDHWQAQKDRRYLLSLINLLEKKLEKAEKNV